MDRGDVAWKGYWPAAPTPFTQTGELDLGGWRNLLRMYLRQDVHGVLVNGSTGEWFSQTDEERRELAQAAVEELGGQVPVVIGCSSFTPEQTIALARHARQIGADGVLFTPPPYAVPTSREVEAFYRAVSEAVEIPIMVYNWPRGTNVDIDSELAIALAKIPNVVAIKDSTANKARALETLEAVVDRLRVFGTFISRAGIGILGEIGGDGNIDGGGLGAADGVGFYEAFWAGNLPVAREHARRYTQLTNALIKPDWSGRFGSPVSQLKAAMGLLGQPAGIPRPPLLPVDDPEALRSLAVILRQAGLLQSNSALA